MPLLKISTKCTKVKMKSKLLIFIYSLFQIASSQTFNSTIFDILNQVSLDSLIKKVRILSGEDSVIIGNSTVLIQSRTNNLTDHEMPGHKIANEYLIQELKKYTPDVVSQNFKFRDDTVRNIIARINGIDTTKKIIISAHYDSRVTPYDPLYSPGADDNASGVSAVLESARLLNRIVINNSVYFILWDMEEDGCLGSEYYANNHVGDTNYIAMLNLDMIAYDTLNIGKVDLWCNEMSNPLIKIIDNINNLYSIGLTFNYYEGNAPGDAFPFMMLDICPSVLFSEYYWKYEYNYNYLHSPSDKIEHFNLNYYHKIVKLGIGTLIELALNGIQSKIKYVVTNASIFTLLPAIPNPFNPITTIHYQIPEQSFVEITAYNLLGQEVKRLVKEQKPAGTYSVNWDAGNLSSGIYLIRMTAGSFTKVQKCILLK